MHKQFSKISRNQRELTSQINLILGEMRKNPNDDTYPDPNAALVSRTLICTIADAALPILWQDEADHELEVFIYFTLLALAHGLSCHRLPDELRKNEDIIQGYMAGLIELITLYEELYGLEDPEQSTQIVGLAFSLAQQSKDQCNKIVQESIIRILDKSPNDNTKKLLIELISKSNEATTVWLNSILKLMGDDDISMTYF